MKIKKNLTKNVTSILRASKTPITRHSVQQILLALNLTNSNIYNLQNALYTLKNILEVHENQIAVFQELELAFKEIENIEAIEPFLEYFGSRAKSHRSGNFLINNKRFGVNHLYGLFAGMPADISDCFTLIIDVKSISHIPIVTHAMVIVLVINLTQNIETPLEGFKAFCNDVKKLVSLIDWQIAFKDVIKKYLTEISPPQDFEIKELITALENDNKLFDHLLSAQKEFLKKLIQFTKDANERIQNASPPTYQGVALNQLSTLPIIPSSSRTDTNIIKELQAELLSENDEEKESSAFLKTVNQRFQKLESESHVLKHTKNMLTESEVASVESAIFKKSTGLESRDNEILSTQLCWALQLYYSVPLKAIKLCLIGTPGIDFSISKMVGCIAFDIDQKVVYFPSPMQNLNDDPKKYYHHTTIPLHRRIGAAIRFLKKTSTPGCHTLEEMLHPNSFQHLSSFKFIENFRQYRITPRKISHYLWQNIQLNCRDEVKTAYLQGGSYLLLHMGIYYTTLNVSDLHELFLEITKKVFKNAAFFKYDMTNDPLVGSEKRPSNEQVKVFFREKRKLLKQLDGSKISSSQELVEFHNQLALYTVAILNLATTHRPHQDPYHSLQNFIDGRWVQISEKVIKKGVEGRLSVINEICNDQLSAYCSHLKLFQKSLETSQDQVLASKFISLLSPNKLLREGLPLFFTIENDSLKPISKKIMSQYLQSIDGIVLKDNFYRHLFSSYMAKNGVSRMHIAAQMGHITKGLEPYSPNLYYSPVIQEQALRPMIDQLFEEFDIKAFLPRSKRFYPIKESLTYIFKPWRLGPFKRLDQRKTPISKEDLNAINMLFFKDKAVPTSIRIPLSTQKTHAKEIKSIYSKNSYRKLSKYYDFHKKYSGWRIEVKSVRKSPFDWHFPSLYQKGALLYDQLKKCFNESMILSQTQDQKNLRILLALSAIYSSSIRIKEYCLAIMNTPKSSFKDFKLTLLTTIHDPIGSRTWLLNSLSTLIVQNLDDSHLAKELTEKDLNDWLTNNNFPEITPLIRLLNGYFQVFLPNYLNHYGITPSLQNGLDINQFYALFEGHPTSNIKPLPVSASSNIKNDFLQKTVNKNDRDDFVKELKKTLNEAKEQKWNYSEALSSIESLEEKYLDLDFVVSLLVLWVKDRLKEGRLDKGSIRDYFNRIYKYILLGFQKFQSLEEIDDEVLLHEVYPSILQEMEVTISIEQRLYTSELKDFHQCLVKYFDFEPLHFEGGRVINRSKTESIVLPQVLSICRQAIQGDNSISSEDRAHMEVSLILYAKLGLRLSEIFYITPADVDLTDKIIYIHGNRKNSLKRPASNRLIPYQQLLEKDQLQQFETIVKKCHIQNPKRPFLFSYNHSVRQKEIKENLALYLTQLLQAISGEHLTIKSMRKTFASSLFLKLIFHDTGKWLLKEAGLKPNTDSILQQHLETTEPHQKFWVLANYIGHTTPQTTFGSYVLTLELANFYHSENLLEQQKDYSNFLKGLTTSKPVVSSKIRNLNLYPGEQYARYYKSSIYQPLPVYKWGTIQRTSFAKSSLCVKDIEKVVVFISLQFEPEKINELTSIPVEQILRIRQVYRHMMCDLFSTKKIPIKLEQRFISQLTFFNFNDDKWQDTRRSKLLEPLTQSLIDDRVDQKSILYLLWKTQINKMVKLKGEWYFDSRSNLKKMIKQYDNLANVTAKLQIKLIGNKFSHQTENIQFGEHRVRDDREIDDANLPLTEYLVSITTSTQESLNHLTCKKCLGYALFFSVLRNLL